MVIPHIKRPSNQTHVARESELVCLAVKQSGKWVCHASLGETAGKAQAWKDTVFD